MKSQDILLPLNLVISQSLLLKPKHTKKLVLLISDLLYCTFVIPTAQNGFAIFLI